MAYLMACLNVRKDSLALLSILGMEITRPGLSNGEVAENRIECGSQSRGRGGSLAPLVLMTATHHSTNSLWRAFLRDAKTSQGYAMRDQPVGKKEEEARQRVGCKGKIAGVREVAEG